jgi:DNA-binding response OmpR family regulator
MGLSSRRANYVRDLLVSNAGILRAGSVKTQPEKDFDLVLLDVRMPGLSGIEALPRLLTDYPDTSVVMMTGVVDAATAIECMKLGADDYICKPFNLEEFFPRSPESSGEKATATGAQGVPAIPGRQG